MKKINKSLALVLGSALTASGAITTANAAENNPFAVTELSSGYDVAMSKKGKDGKCGEGKCGSKKKKDGKCGEGKCGSKKKKEGKCGEGKCGSKK